MSEGAHGMQYFLRFQNDKVIDSERPARAGPWLRQKPKRIVAEGVERSLRTRGADPLREKKDYEDGGGLSFVSLKDSSLFLRREFG